MPFLQRWIKPRSKRLFCTDITLYISLLLPILLIIFPCFTGGNLSDNVKLQDLSSAVVAFSALGIGISVALASFVANLPNVRLRPALMSKSTGMETTPFSDLAFMAFWAGMSNLFAAFISITTIIFAGNQIAFEPHNIKSSVFSFLVCFTTLYALQQMANALIALLEASGLIEKYETSSNPRKGDTNNN